MDKNSSTYKTILLAVVCSVAGACLAAANAVTKPVIDENAIASVKVTLNQFFPNAEFSDVTSQYVTKDYPLVDAAYEAKDQGYIFTCHNTGYSSSGFKFIIAFAKDGSIVGYEGLEQNETSGKGSLAFEQSYIDEVTKLTSSDALPLISGATITTTAVKEAAAQAEAIFNKIEGITADPSSASSTTSTTTSGASTTSGATSTASAAASASASTSTTSGATAEASSSTTSGASTKSSSTATSASLGTADYSSASASCTASSDGVYACKATGFKNASVSATITVKDNAIVSISDLTGGDKGDNVGDAWYSDASAFNGATLDSTIDAMSGATYTSNAVRGMAAAALKAAAGK
jgi:Na+-translocating ferredoxin:NAD+ oxidoreductase RnfG subunit